MGFFFSMSFWPQQGPVFNPAMLKILSDIFPLKRNQCIHDFVTVNRRIFRMWRGWFLLIFLNFACIWTFHFFCLFLHSYPNNWAWISLSKNVLFLSSLIHWLKKAFFVDEISFNFGLLLFNFETNCFDLLSNILSVVFFKLSGEIPSPGFLAIADDLTMEDLMSPVKGYCGEFFTRLFVGVPSTVLSTMLCHVLENLAEANISDAVSAAAAASSHYSHYLCFYAKQSVCPFDHEHAALFALVGSSC